MNPESACPRCGVPIPPEAPRGLCPRCLMDGALASDPQGATPQAPSVDELSAVFPQLEVFELLGSGGMGCVYKARQTHLDRIIALKILPPDLAADPAFAERFAREARALAKLNHPNIVQCFDFGRSDPVSGQQRYFYLLLEFVDGVNLRQTMHTSTLTAREALGIVPRLCDALNYAHEQGVLHRDIKPENILIDKRGRVKIADFGLARFQKEEDGRNAMTLTMSGAQLGTAAYMAPEQIEQPHAVDHRADIYSLGVVFYEMLTGGLPLGRFAPPSETSGVDPRLDSVVFRTLEKQKERRFQSAGAVQSEVETIAGTPTPTPHAAFSSAAPQDHPDALKTGRALAFPPSWMTVWNWIWRQPFLFQRGQLTLESHQLVYQASAATLSIPLDRIDSVSLAPLPFVREPLGRCPIAVRWRDAAERVQTTCFLTGSASWAAALPEEQVETDAWVLALCQAATDRQGFRPEIAAETRARCAEVTPALPDFPRIAWVLACLGGGIVALSALVSGAPLLAVPLACVLAAFSFGLWRRRGIRPVPSEARTTSPPTAPPPPSQPPPSAVSEASGAPRSEREATAPAWNALARKFCQLARGFAAGCLAGLRRVGGMARARVAAAAKADPNPTGPRHSKLALWAFGLATLGWALLFIGPILGSVLGWIALSKMKQSEQAVRGRGLALFAALQAPLILIVAALGGSAVTLWEHDLMPIPYTIAILTLTTLVFLGIRSLFRITRVRGLWAWKQRTGIAAVLLGIALLTTTAWALEDLQDKWPFAGRRSTVRLSLPDGEPGSGRVLARALAEGPYGDVLEVGRTSRRDRSVQASIVTTDGHSGIAFLQRVEDALASEYPGLRMHLERRAHRGWNPDGPHGAELFITLGAIACAAGASFAASGFGSGGLGLLVALALSITLHQMPLPSPFGVPVLDPVVERPVSDPPFPTRIDGIQLQ